MSYLDSLNSSQRAAVTQTEGPVMIIAGAGSGKTRVLTYRIAHLIAQGVSPFNILSLTFTNKAAREMRDRIEQVVGTEARSLWMGTFHSVFAKILRFESEKIGYPSNFTIYDTDDSKSLIRSIVKENGLDDKVYKPNVVLNRISAAKNRLVSYHEYNNNPVYKQDDDSFQRPEIGRIYKLYCERCFRAGAMDFDDLLFNTNVLFRDHLDVLNKYQNMFHYVMVDEFQDTNLSQYLITKKLAAKNRNIAVVGDDAQSIYAFRGADIQNILNFEKDYSELNVYKLEQNYRSSQTIVEAANAVIKHNTAQIPKNTFTSNSEGAPIEILTASSDGDEGRLVANSIFERKNNEQAALLDFAILYRTNAQSRSIEEALRRMGIHYKIFGGLSFYQRKEIKDVIAYLRLTLNPSDEEAFKRVINYPKRGIGDTTIAKIIVYANENKLSLWDAIKQAKQVVSPRIAQAIEQFVYLLQSFQLAIQTKDAYESARQIAKETGILRELYNDKTIEGLARHENVQELLNAIKEYVDAPEKENKSLAGFLEEVSLLTDADTQKTENEDFVSLMTIHSSKGLEFKNVYIVGLEEDLFPSQMMLSSRADLEEERRLFYVAITRAEKNLTLSHAHSRYRFGQIKNCEPSRFLTEVPPALIKQVKRRPTSFNSTADLTENKTSYSNLLKNFQNRSKTPPTRTASSPTNTAFQSSDTSNLSAQMQVEHPKFGMGTVVEVETQGNNRKAIIDFKNHGRKTLLLSFAKLKIHA